MDKKVLVDADGVLLDYFSDFYAFHGLEFPDEKSIHDGFHGHLEYPMDVIHGMVEEFNVHECFANLEPYKKADKFVNKLHQQGYEFVVITACGNDPKTMRMRRENLEQHFPGVFEEIYFVDHGDSKYRYLQQYEGSHYIWIEDNVDNYFSGEILGLSSLLMKTPFNKHEFEDEIHEVHDWNEIYFKIKNWYEH